MWDCSSMSFLSVFSAHNLWFSCYTGSIEKSWGWACNFGAPRCKNLSPYMCLNWWSLKFCLSRLVPIWCELKSSPVTKSSKFGFELENPSKMRSQSSSILGTYKGSNSFTLAHETCILEHLSCSYVWVALQDLSSTEGGKLKCKICYIQFTYWSTAISVNCFCCIQADLVILNPNLWTMLPLHDPWALFPHSNLFWLQRNWGSSMEIWCPVLHPLGNWMSKKCRFLCIFLSILPPFRMYFYHIIAHSLFSRYLIKSILCTELQT